MHLRGLLFPSKGPYFFALTRLLHPNHRHSIAAFEKLNPRNGSHWFHAPQHGNICLPQHVLHLRFF